MTLAELRKLLHCSDYKIKQLATYCNWQLTGRAGYAITQEQALEGARAFGLNPTKRPVVGIQLLENCVNLWPR